MAGDRRSRDAALGRCRKHPWNRQSPGVCSLCLGERLSRLSASSSRRKPSCRRVIRSASSSSPSSVSTNYSSSSEPSYCPSRHGRLADEAKSGPLLLSAFFGRGRDCDLKKSRSMATETAQRVAGVEGKKKKKSGGFWSKLVNRRKKWRESDNKALKRSGATVREKVTTT